MIKKSFVLLCLLGCSSSAFAMFCPNGFNQISMGDNTAKVEAQCGKPDFIKVTKLDNNGPQEWNYYVAQEATPGAPPPTGPQASVKMAIAMSGGKVINITANGTSLASTSLCGMPLSVGADAKTVEDTCGKPSFVNKSSQDTGAKATEMTEFKYNSTPAVILTFEDGNLIKRE